MSDFATTGDGLIAALQVLTVMRLTDKPVSELGALFSPLPQVLKNIKYGDTRLWKPRKFRLRLRLVKTSLAIRGDWLFVNLVQSRLSA